MLTNTPTLLGLEPNSPSLHQTQGGSFAALCGASPIEASSCPIVRHRLNQGGNRTANNALWRVVLVRMRWDQRTRDYVARRTAEGKTKREIIRCLKRYVAREIYRTLREPTTATAHSTTHG